MKQSKFDRVSSGLRKLGIDSSLFEAIDAVMMSIMEGDEQDTAEALSDEEDYSDSEDTETDANPEFPMSGNNVELLYNAVRDGQTDEYLSMYADGMSLEDYADACAIDDKDYIDDNPFNDPHDIEGKKAAVDKMVEEIKKWSETSIKKNEEKKKKALEKINEMFKKNNTNKNKAKNDEQPVVKNPEEKQTPVEKTVEEKKENKINNSKKTENTASENKPSICPTNIKAVYQALTNSWRGLEEITNTYKGFSSMNDLYDRSWRNNFSVYEVIQTNLERDERAIQLIEDKEKQNECSKEVYDILDTIVSRVPIKDGTNIGRIYFSSIEDLPMRMHNDPAARGVSTEEYLKKKLDSDEDSIKSIIKDEEKQKKLIEELHKMYDHIIKKINTKDVETHAQVKEMKPSADEIRGKRIQDFVNRVNTIDPETLKARRERIKARIQSLQNP